MATTAAGIPASHSFRPSFFFWIAVVMALFIFGGFGLTYWQPMATGSLVPLPPIVHVHGAFFTAWIVLLLAQSALINSRRVALHRALGSFGIAIATGVLFTGSLLTLMFGNAYTTDTPSYYDLMYLGLMAMLLFGILFTLAIRRVRQPDQHRRLILFATIPLLPPGINRLYQVVFALPDLPVLATYLTMDAIAAAILFYDWKTTRSLNRATLIGALAVFGQQLLHVPIVNSASFAALCSWLTNLVYYR